MVTTGERKLVSIALAEKLIKESRTTEEAVEKLRHLQKRQPAPPPPPGGISQSAASRKYKISQTTISGWVLKRYIPELLRTTKEVYIDEKKLVDVIACFKAAPGQGKKTVKRKFAA
jgi:hypothetical protein